MRLTLIVLLLVPLSLAFVQQVAPTQADLAKAPLVKIEELVAHPEQYDRQIIRVNALWVSGYHGSLVCPINDERDCIAAHLECSESERCEDMKKVLQQNLEAGSSGEFWDKRAQLSVVGRFKNTPQRTENSPRFSLWVLNIEAVSPKPSG